MSPRSSHIWDHIHSFQCYTTHTWDLHSHVCLRLTESCTSEWTCVMEVSCMSPRSLSHVTLMYESHVSLIYASPRSSYLWVHARVMYKTTFPHSSVTPIIHETYRVMYVWVNLSHVSLVYESTFTQSCNSHVWKSCKSHLWVHARLIYETTFTHSSVTPLIHETYMAHTLDMEVFDPLDQWIIHETVVGSLKLQVSIVKEPYKRGDILQKRPTDLHDSYMTKGSKTTMSHEWVM